MTALGSLIDAPLLTLDDNHAITHTHHFLCPSINHSTHKTKNVTQKGGREEQHGEEMSCDLVPEEEWMGRSGGGEGRLKGWIRLTRMKYRPLLFSNKHTYRLCRHRTHLRPVPLSFLLLPPSSPPSWGGAGEHSWVPAPAPPLWALILYSCAPYSLTPPSLYLTPPVLSYPIWPFYTLNTFFTSYSQVTHVKQPSSATLHSTKDTHIATVTHTYVHTQIYTHKTMHCMHAILCFLVPGRWKHSGTHTSTKLQM